jgi:putative Mg2+ transporter-C (MgtC) family protein
MEFFSNQLSPEFYSDMGHLGVAAILGGLIGLERELRHKPAGLRTNMFICFGSAMFTMLSGQLAGSWGGDHTRIAAQIVTGIGFIGGGAILRERGSITGLTSAATIFVSAAVGMAAGGGLYLMAGFATLIILIALTVFGKIEHHLEQKRLRVNYEITGPRTESVLAELNRILAEKNITMEDVHAASIAEGSRVVFTVSGLRLHDDDLTVRLHQSNVFFSVQTLGVTGKE